MVFLFDLIGLGGFIKALKIIFLAISITPCLTFADNTVIDFDGKNPVKPALFHDDAQNESRETPQPSKEEAYCVKKAFILDENGVLKELKPDRSWIDERGRRANEYNKLPQSSMSWSLYCQNQTGQQWAAKETYSYAYPSGGHSHFDPPGPALKVTDIQLGSTEPPSSAYKEKPSPFGLPTMLSNTTYYYWELIPEFSTKIMEVFEPYGGCEKSQVDYLNVMVSGLAKMAPGQNYILYNSEEAAEHHPESHYGTQSLIDVLVGISDEYKSAIPDASPIEINDMSLPWGGLFDLDMTWVTSPANHEMHRCGNQADIRKIKIPDENRRKFIEIACKKTKFLLSEEPPYYHIATSRQINYIEMSRLFYCRPPKLEEGKYIQCCKDDGTIDEATIESCVK